ncbi:MAG: aminotransferase class V-fold PLP-dependent enzyme [Candidatus Thorarchaeota archaeon]|nr:aminotransferase class V-fold PLP-dependent enzyme [Candidatus Thorarchaeota archaeon]
MTLPLDVRKDFPVLRNIPSLAYFDSASTCLMPDPAIDAMVHFLRTKAVSSRRGAHRLAVEGANTVEECRAKIAALSRTEPRLLSFQHSVALAVASVAYGYDWKRTGRTKITVSQTEDHDVVAPLIRAAQVLRLRLETIPLRSDGTLDPDTATRMIDKDSGLVAISPVSPGTGDLNPIRELCQKAHEEGCVVISDLTRSMGFSSFEFQSVGSDIVLCSANSGLLGPPGLAIQWMSDEAGMAIRPGIAGSSAVSNVEGDSFDFSLPPDMFEPGFVNVPGVAGLSAAIDYISSLGVGQIKHQIRSISNLMSESLGRIDGLILYGTHHSERTIFSFNVGNQTADNVNCHDVALLLDESDIAVRSGFLCAQPLVHTLSADGVVQASIHVYNSIDDMIRLRTALEAIAGQLL